MVDSTARAVSTVPLKWVAMEEGSGQPQSRVLAWAEPEAQAYVGPQSITGESQSGGDTTPPTVDFVSPQPGATIGPDTSITLRVRDESGDFCNVALRVRYQFARPVRPEETIYTGTRFAAFYEESTVTEIEPGELEFVVRRVNPDPDGAEQGWPSTPTFEVDPVDTGGNRSS